MQKIVNQVRELEKIEKELNSNPVGVRALNVDNEKVIQVTTTFIYIDKNIYIFFGENDEIFGDINSESMASFTVIKYNSNKKRPKLKFEPTYDVFSISVFGQVKNVEENKTLEEVRNSYAKKYKKEISGDINFSHLSKAIILDSVEIQAFEEFGG